LIFQLFKQFLKIDFSCLIGFKTVFKIGKLFFLPFCFTIATSTVYSSIPILPVAAPVLLLSFSLHLTGASYAAKSQFFYLIRRKLADTVFLYA